MSFVKLLMSVPDSAVTMADHLQLNVAGNHFDVEGLDKLVGDMLNGALVSYTKLSTGSVQATATMTSTAAAIAEETATVANVTLTAKTSGAVAASGEFNLDADNTVQAINITAAINAVAGLSGIVTAASVLGVVTITAVQPGLSGDGLDITEALTGVTVTAFASGSDGSQVAIDFGASS